MIIKKHQIFYKMHCISKRKTDFLNKKQYIFKQKERAERKHARHDFQITSAFIEDIIVFTLDVILYQALFSRPEAVR